MRTNKHVCRSAVLAGAILPLLWSITLANTVGHGQGGRFEAFDPIISEFNQSGKEFRIDGTCKSACTMFLSIRNVCVSRDARLYFHAGNDSQHNISTSATNHMMHSYNSKLRKYIADHHYMTTLSFDMIAGAVLIDELGYRECGKNK